MDISLIIIWSLNTKIDMLHQFSLQNMAARNSLATATSDSGIIILKMEFEEE